MAERLWDTAAAVAECFRQRPKVSNFLRAFDRSTGDFAGRVDKLTTTYSPLRISPLLLGVRLNHMPATEQLLEPPDGEAWLHDAVQVGTAFQIIVEFVRSRLPAYPVLRVPHRRPGSPYLVETDEHFFHHFPRERELTELDLQQAGPPDMTKLGGTDDCAEQFNGLVVRIGQRESWRRFADSGKALSKSDLAALTDVGNRFADAVADDVVVQQAGNRLFAQFEYRMAVLEDHVRSTSGAVLDYLRAFEEVDQLISIVAAYMQTLIVNERLLSVAPERIDLGEGGEILPVNLLVRPDDPFLNPGEVMMIEGPPAPHGLVYPEGVQHAWGRLDDPGGSTATIEGKFISLCSAAIMRKG